MYVELVSKVAKDEPVDEVRIATAREKVPVCLEVLSDLLRNGVWFSGDYISLADIYLAPMLDYFLMVPEGREMFFKKYNLAEWWHRLNARESLRTTRPVN